MSSTSNKDNSNSLGGRSVIGKALPPGGYIEGNRVYHRTCPVEYDGPKDRHFIELNTTGMKTTFIDMLEPSQDFSEEGRTASYLKAIEMKKKGLVERSSAEMKLKIQNMIKRNELQHKANFGIQEELPVKARPMANNQVMIEISEILANIAGKSLSDEMAGKRKRIQDEEYVNPVELTPCKIMLSNFKAKKLYTQIIMERDIWPKWMHKWFKGQAVPISNAIQQNQLTTRQFNVVHRTFTKLRHHIQDIEYPRDKLEYKQVMPLSRQKKNIQKVHRARLTYTAPKLEIKLRINGIKYRKKRFRLCLTQPIKGKPTNTFKRGHQQIFRPPAANVSFKMDNISITSAVNTRRETWKRRKKKATMANGD